MILNHVLREFLYEIQIKNYTPRTIKGYKNNLAKLFKYCESELEILELEEITYINIKQYLNYLKDKGLTATYINKILKNIRSFYAYCYKEGYCLNIAKKVSWLREKKVIIKTFNDKEVKKCLMFINLIVILMLVINVLFQVDMESIIENENTKSDNEFVRKFYNDFTEECPF